MIKGVDNSWYTEDALWRLHKPQKHRDLVSITFVFASCRYDSEVGMIWRISIDMGDELTCHGLSQVIDALVNKAAKDWCGKFHSSHRRRR